MEKKQCLICNATDNLENAFSAIGALTSWRFTQSGLMPTTKFYEAKDDLEIWELTACKSCLSKGYLKYLQLERKKIIHFLWKTPLYCLAGAAIAVGMFLIAIASESVLNVIIKWAAFVFSAIIIGGAIYWAVKIPGSLIKITALTNEINETEKNTVIPPNEELNAFVGVGEMVLANIKKNAKHTYSLKLPVFVDHSSQPMDANPKKVFRFLNCNKDELELIENFDSEWREVFKKKTEKKELTMN